MADPLRRTLLAKLRGKKSKKGTPAGGFSVAAASAANGGNREGKEKFLQLQQGDEQHEQAMVVSSAGGVSVLQNTMWVQDSCINGDFDVKREVSLLRESVVVGTASSHSETLMHPINRRGIVQSSEEFHFRTRVNEQLFAVSLRDANAKGSKAGRLRSCNEQDSSFMRLAVPVSLGEPEGQKQITRDSYSRDSIGFGICENHGLPERASSDAVTTASTNLTGGQYFVSESKNMGKEKYPVTLGDETDFFQQSDYDFGFIGNFVKRTEPNFTADFNRNHETDVQVNETEMYTFAAPAECLRHATGTLEESSLIKHTERYVSGLTYSREYSAVNLQNPAFFPIDLENLVPSLACQNYASLEPREGIQRHNSIDSEDDDYYDNETLLCYEPEIKNYQIHNNTNNNTSKDTPISSLVTCETGDGFGKGANYNAEETDRLRTQLNEAYFLLINAMHDISINSQPGSNGFCDDLNTSSCHSQDSVCTHSSARALDSDAWSFGDSPPHVSDTDSLFVNHTEICNASAKWKVVSKSVENLSVVATRPPLLQRSVSAGDIKYATEHALGSTHDLKNNTCPVSNDTRDGETEIHYLVAENSYAKRLSSYDGVSSDDLLQEYGDNALLIVSSGSVTSSTGSRDTVEVMDSKIDDCNEGQVNSAKPLGVTVNKMQQWIHKGRLLSSEMKQRITGSSLRGRGSSRSPRGQAVKKEKGATKTSPGGQGSNSGSNSQTILQTDLIENVRNSSMGRRDRRVIMCKEVNEPKPPVNSITVSKKRNWLEQSSYKPQSHEECAAATEDDCGHVANPSSSENPRQSGTCATLPAGQGDRTVHITVSPTLTCPRTVDPAEENDADDEGDIWYNPIPEDEEPELLQGLCPAAKRKNSQALHSLVPVCSQRKLSNGDSVKGLESTTAGSSPYSSQIPGDCQAVPTSEINLANSVHSTERLQLHRQLFACKLGSGAAIEENPAPKPSTAITGPTDCTYTSDPGFSPPSSPNPLKKGGSINWSFPEKIKSPRTVRKLSIKMKKLPELSRKLSVKGTSNSSHPEPQPASPKSSGSSSGTEYTQDPPLSPGSSTAASRNVISRYHLDSSVSTQHSYKKKNDTGSSKSASKGGYLSDGDSPELVTKSGKHKSESKSGKSKEPPTNNHKVHVTEIDIDAFRHYSFADKPKCSQYISGLVSVHFYGAEDLKSPRIDSKEVYCAIQVDSVNKARTALLTCKTTFLDMDHTFNIELENAQHLKLVVFSWEPMPKRNRVCCHGTVVLPTLFRVTRTHQLAVKLEPRGKIYVKLNLMEQWQNSLDCLGREREPTVFGVEAWKLVEKENAGIMVPLLIEKCITEIENRGCQVVGLYRLCGSAAVKKELREAFERDSKSVELSENQYPDINVITGVLKDYLRELPFPLITKQLYEAVLDAMVKRPLRIGPSGCENEQCDSEYTVSLLEHLPEVEKVTLRMLLDHLKRVASYHEVNKMTCQNLAVCFGPVLLSQRQETSHYSNRVFIDSEELASALDFKKHIEVLHYLLQLWPGCR
ncbi:rho GTPase-activating protein SYDE2-like isoform X2 [Acipenser ruthenus]|uniref:rho GTPase-activating protein SYDE2-like isoform X2 n=1 Tax=Acipenser ruthenus TaxID=7906 RepID=UPI0027409A27|nr:rho GTPase-activating protein SYDE2-like isoform X2 [Acipenser ruthenus]